MTDRELFLSRLEKTEACSRCEGHGRISVGYALHPWDDSLPPLHGIPENTVRVFVGGSFSVFESTKEAADLARQADRPVAFGFIDHVVVVRPGDDPDQVARAWWLLQYGETPEVTRYRR